MKQLILQKELTHGKFKECINKFHLETDGIPVTLSKILIEFKNWVDDLILRITPSGASYPVENRVDEITDIDYTDKDELYAFFTSFLDSNSLNILNPFISTLINTVYTWTGTFEEIVNTFYDPGTICPCFGKTKFSINYPRLKMYSSLTFFVQ